MKVFTYIISIIFFVIFTVAQIPWFDLHDPDMFLWGGTYYYYIRITAILLLAALVIILTDSFLKNKKWRIGALLILAATFIYTLIKYGYIYHFITLDDEKRYFLYPDSPWHKPFPFFCQLTSWIVIAVMILYFGWRIYHPKNKTN